MLRILVFGFYFCWGLAPLSRAQSVVRPLVTFTNPWANDQDDMTVWHGPEGQSGMVFAADKHADFVFVYSMAGQLLYRLNYVAPGNIDTAYGVETSVGIRDVITFNLRKDGTLGVIAIDPMTGALEALHGDFAIGDNYGSTVCVGSNGDLYVVISTKSGALKQFHLDLSGERSLLHLVKRWRVGSQAEGVVCDGSTDRIYVAEEAVGIWSFPLDSRQPKLASSVAMVGKHGFVGDVEGITIYRGSRSRYLMASSQGSNSFHIFDLSPPHQHLKSFTIAGVGETDGIYVSNSPYKGADHGLFLAHNGWEPKEVIGVSLAEIFGLPWLAGE